MARGFRFEAPRLTCLWLLPILTISIFALPARADQIKANNTSNLETGASWISGVPPTGIDNAIWNSTVATPANCTNTLGAAVTWGGIVITNPAAPVYISGSTTLTLSNAIRVLRFIAHGHARHAAVRFECNGRRAADFERR